MLGQELPKIVSQIFRCGVTLRGTFGNGLVADAFQFFGNVVVILAWGTRLVTCHLFQKFCLRIASERLATDQQLLEHQAETEDVTSAIEFKALRLFR